MRSLAMNPCRENPRRRRRHKKRNPFGVENPKRRRRRNPFGGVRGGPKMGLAELFKSAIFISAGAMLARIVPERILKIDATADSKKRAFAALGTGVGVGLLGARFLGAKNAQLLALGGMSTGVNMLVEEHLPEQLRVSGLFVGESLSDSDLDKMLRKEITGVDFSVEEIQGPDDEITGIEAGEDVEITGVEEVSGGEGLPGSYYNF